MVDRNQNADEVIHRVRQNNQMESNLTAMIERIMAQNGLNTGLRRPNYTSRLSDYVLQTELSRGRKIPKFIKFSGDTSESTTEHIVRYMIEAGDLANNEDLRMKYFPSSLTKNAFTWFTTLPPNSIDTWSQLERLFHEQFYMGQTKISLKELDSIKRKFTELIDDYLNRFRLLKARCFTVVPEHELVEMAARGLDYSIRKKLDTQYLRDMAQLADRVRQVERLKAEKARANKSNKKERVTYVEVNEGEPEISEDQYGFEDCEVDLAELKEADPYTCKMITPSNVKNPVEIEKNDKDLIQNAIKEGRLKFADEGRNQMKIDANPLNIADTNYTEPVEINMLDMVEVGARGTPGDEEDVQVGKQVTDDLKEDVTSETSVEPKTTEGLVGKTTMATVCIRLEKKSKCWA
ncbi:uncharacterized protein LOC131619378 [Vicia villosa]|uniref:uncharacterized protein LOC131619378 n=1 Tax=Vicia villosa TaxID=3911 RepID=UPI00273CE3DE|nr:uncharacterized protein LOC131619378 [Vicia villosa]